MMKLIQNLLVFVLGISVNTAFAGDAREIRLVDGSVISGEIVSFGKGVYTLKTKGIGIIKISESEIDSIRFTGPDRDAGTGERPLAATGSAVQALQQMMMNDAAIMEIILSLQNDPDLQKILNDPAVMQLVTSGNVNALMSNQKFQRLLGNRKIQEIEKKIHK